MTGTTAARVRGESGFTLIDMLFVVALIGLISTLAIPGLMRARLAANSASAMGTIRVVNSAQLSYAITCGLGFYAPDFPALGMKPPRSVDAFLPPDLTSGAVFYKAGYNFSMAATPLAASPESCNGVDAGESGAGYAIVADQVEVSGTARFLGSNADGVIYEHTSSLGGTMPETGPPADGVPLTGK